jgi:hypothetical protein
MLDQAVFDELDYDQATYEKAYQTFDFSVDNTLSKVASAIAPMLAARSAYQPFLGARAESALQDQAALQALNPAMQAAQQSAAQDTSIIPLLGSLAALYAAYRDKIPVTQMGLLALTVT